MIKLRNLRGQVTIYIIVAVVIVAIIGFYFLFRGGIKVNPITVKPDKDLKGYVERCIEPSIEDGLEIILGQGGYIENNLTFHFDDQTSDYTDIAFLCFATNSYTQCINQEPLLIKHIEKEIKNYVAEDLETCFQKAKTELEKNDYSVSIGEMDFNVKLKPGKIKTNINREVTLTRTDSSSTEDKFEFSLNSKLYEILLVVNEIVSQEARFCNFEKQGFMIYYPEFSVDRFKTSEDILIYTVTDKKTEERFRFAIRTCIIPPGMER